MATHPPTDEQAHARDLFRQGNDLAIVAGAGTGKTSTLELIARGTMKRIQYVAFNRAIVREAATRFPSNVNARTAHQLAMADIGRSYSHRLDSKRMKGADIAAILGIGDLAIMVDGKQKRLSASALAGHTMRMVERFCQSAGEHVRPQHLPYVEGIDSPGPLGRRRYDNNRLLAEHLVPFAELAWADLSNVHGRLQFGHAHYLKLWQLSEPTIAADVIEVDESQDISPVMMSVFERQSELGAQVVWVGDDQQQIYEFTGAINALSKVNVTARCYLTKSFRFGPAIAAVANQVLAKLDAQLRLTGHDPVASRVGPVATPDCVLSRTNAVAVATMLEAQMQGLRVHLVGGDKEIATFARAAAKLMAGGRTDHKDLSCFDSWPEVVGYVADDPAGSDLRLLVRLMDDYGPETILAATDLAVTEAAAHLVVSTAHKAKGREWDRVKLAGDFPDGLDDEHPGAEFPGAELRLLYVAATRAKLELDVGAVGVLRPEPVGIPAWQRPNGPVLDTTGRPVGPTGDGPVPLIMWPDEVIGDHDDFRAARPPVADQELAGNWTGWTTIKGLPTGDHRRPPYGDSDDDLDVESVGWVDGESGF